MNTLSRYLAVSLIWAPCAVMGADDVTERAVPGQPPLRQLGFPSAGASLEQQVTLLQQQVQALQAQMAALQSVLRVTQTGTTLQAPSLALISNGDVTVQAGGAIAMRSGTGTAIKAGTVGSLEAPGMLDLKGSQVRINGGNKPMATVGSLVQVPGQPNGQIVTGTASILGN